MASFWRLTSLASPCRWNSLPDRVRNPNSTEAAFRRLLKTFLFARYQHTQRMGGGEFRRYAIQIYTSTLALTWIFDIVPCVKEWQEGRERLDEGTTNVRGKGEQEWQGRKGSHTWYGSVFRTSVFGWRTFPDLRLIYGWYLTTLWIKCPLWVNQPGQFSLLGR